MGSHESECVDATCTRCLAARCARARALGRPEVADGCDACKEALRQVLREGKMQMDRGERVDAALSNRVRMRRVEFERAMLDVYEAGGSA